MATTGPTAPAYRRELESLLADAYGDRVSTGQWPIYVAGRRTDDGRAGGPS